MGPDLAEVEIHGIAPLGPEQAALLDSHSILNVCNVIAGELVMLGLTLGNNPDLFPSSIRLCHALAEGLRDFSKATNSPELSDSCADRVEEELGLVTKQHPARMIEPSVIESLRNLREVVGILRQQADELRSRKRSPERWESFPTAALRNSFTVFLSAMERCSHGRYKIARTPFVKGPRDYYVELDFNSRPEDRFWLPPAFLDVMGDLTANARKYTPPGGWIVASLYQDPAELRFSVQDSGRGIPSSEIERVVDFGHRASNVTDIRSLGGGFGLTKAFAVTRKAGGRFWIASQEGVGTRVRITIPRLDFAKN